MPQHTLRLVKRYFNAEEETVSYSCGVDYHPPEWKRMTGADGTSQNSKVPRSEYLRVTGLPAEFDPKGWIWMASDHPGVAGEREIFGELERQGSEVLIYLR